MIRFTPMGRPIKNPTHPLARLREELSKKTDHHTVTRKELAKKVGIPETSLRDIENGKYKMTVPIALKFTYALGVSAQSLLIGDDPLLDYLGKPFSKDSRKLPESFLWRPEAQEVREQLFYAAWDAAHEKSLSLLIADGFETWLINTFRGLGLEDFLIKKLTDRLLLLDPSLVPEDFRPKDELLARKWESFDKEIGEEAHRLRREDRIENPNYYARIDNLPVTAEFVIRMNDLRVEARKRVRQRHEEASKAPAAKPPSGKRPRSPGRPVA